jgi:hypothetical protein
VRNDYCDDYYSVYIIATAIKKLSCRLKLRQLKLEKRQRKKIDFMAGAFKVVFLLNHFLIFLCRAMLIKFLLIIHLLSHSFACGGAFIALIALEDP